jgi:hypothetical protein
VVRLARFWIAFTALFNPIAARGVLLEALAPLVPIDSAPGAAPGLMYCASEKIVAADVISFI